MLTWQLVAGAGATPGRYEDAATADTCAACETSNLADRHPEIVAELRPFVQRWVDTGAWKRKDTDVDPAEIEALKALGYVEDDATRAGP